MLIEDIKLYEKFALTSDEVIATCGINRKLLDSYRNHGLIKAIKIGRYWIYPIKEIERFLEENCGKEITKDGIVYETN